MSRPPARQERDIIPDFLQGEVEAIRLVDGWIDVVLRREFQSLESDWEDLRQDVRLRVLACLGGGRFNGASTLRTYVHRIARNTAIDHSRKAYRRRESPSGSGDASPAPDATDTGAQLISRDFLRRILEGLSERERQVIDLVFGQHLSYVEVAGRLGLSEGAVKSLVFRCRDRILKRKRRLLGSEEGAR